ncbi:MAG: hypothetical protein Q7J27_03585 [Syntrophales bacterium]|nr:hypothetical protein [Syntrophales bacterium]
MLMTHGGRGAKRFDWAFSNDYVRIKNENERQEEYSIAEVFAIIGWLKHRFAADWFPLANNVEKLGKDDENDGLGVAILRQQPGKLSHAQGASYLGVVLEHLGLLAWNNRQRGIEWRIIRQPNSLNELRKTVSAKIASPMYATDHPKGRFPLMPMIGRREATEFDFLKTMQEFVATTAIGVSALRNQGKGAHQAVRAALAKMHIAPLRGMGQMEYRQWIDVATEGLLAQWPGTGHPWGAARKSVNLFMRDVLYNQYLSREHDIGHVEKWMEIALDSKVAEGLRIRFPELPAWPGLKHLGQRLSDQYQDCAQQLAHDKGLSRVHLDIWLWLENR